MPCSRAMWMGFSGLCLHTKSPPPPPMPEEDRTATPLLPMVLCSCVRWMDLPQLKLQARLPPGLKRAGLWHLPHPNGCLFYNLSCKPTYDNEQRICHQRTGFQVWLCPVGSHVNLDKNLTSRILGFLFCEMVIMTVTASPGHYVAGENALSAVNSNSLTIDQAHFVYKAQCWGVRADREAGQAE